MYLYNQFFLIHFSKSYRHIHYELNIIYINYTFIKILVFINLIATLSFSSYSYFSKSYRHFHYEFNIIEFNYTFIKILITY